MSARTPSVSVSVRCLSVARHLNLFSRIAEVRVALCEGGGLEPLVPMSMK